MRTRQFWPLPWGEHGRSTLVHIPSSVYPPLGPRQASRPLKNSHSRSTSRGQDHRVARYMHYDIQRRLRYMPSSSRSMTPPSGIPPFPYLALSPEPFQHPHALDPLTGPSPDTPCTPQCSARSSWSISLPRANWTVSSLSPLLSAPLER